MSCKTFANEELPGLALSSVSDPICSLLSFVVELDASNFGAFEEGLALSLVFGLLDVLCCWLFTSYDSIGEDIVVSSALDDPLELDTATSSSKFV